MRFLAPLDNEVLCNVFKRFSRIVTVEDGVLKGGLGTAVIELMCDLGYSAEIRRLGIPDYFVEQGTQAELIKECGFNAESIAATIRDMVWKGVKTPRHKGVKA
jgi:1-deoxy-D-xylulose-5-phosphate synthase